MAAEALDERERVRREPYIGEKRRFMRDGYGTYVYENAFFRYEGEWMKGKKHGHGKLVMKDGTYYEGQFVMGEINGHGYKFFSSSGCKYTGQFLNGEMHGHGIMYYTSGAIYEGQWYKNKKQGFGILRTSEKSVYEGTFHGHVRDGEGTQTYDPTYQKLSNGDRFEGYWMLDKRHGHGDLYCADGSHYSGQFLNDLFNGEGIMKHASGIVYRGLWKDGLPVTLATKIVILEMENPTIIRQGQPFSITVECRDADDNVVQDQGRELLVTAGFKYRKPKEGSALFDVIEDVEDKPIWTPFGYEVSLYPLTDQLSEVEVPPEESDSKMSTMVKEDEVEGGGEEEGEEEAANEDQTEAKDVNAEEPEVTEPVLEVPEGSPPASPPVDASVEDVAGTAKSSKLEENSHFYPPTQSKPTVNGVCEWTNLQLAPPPPMYRPFMIMEEEAGPKRKSKLAQIREKMDLTEEQEGDDDKDENTHENDANDEVEETIEQTEGAVTTMTSKEEFIMPEDVGEDDLERKNSQNPAFVPKNQPEPEKSSPDEKVARTGEYILMVTDVTNPPFMGHRLEPAYLMLKLKKPKKIIVKKPKWDTQRHIAMAMSRSNIET